MLTQRTLKEILFYNHKTGLFVWKIRPSFNSRRKEGEIAGCVKKDEGYRVIKFNGIAYLAHRLAWLYMTGEWPEQIDHINHDRDDNKWRNLREATSLENNKNSSINKNNTSGFTGVYWSKLERKWKAQIKVNNKVIGLGTFVEKEKAILKRQIANLLFGFHENHGVK